MKWEPKVGMICQAKHEDIMNGEWITVEILKQSPHYDRAFACFVMSDKLDRNLYWFDTFRPIPKEPSMKEIMLDKWKHRGLDFAYDGEYTKVYLGPIIDWVVENFDVKEKK
ncbi:hypothetical protein D3C85_517160 [compost metagenome]